MTSFSVTIPATLYAISVILWGISFSSAIGTAMLLWYPETLYQRFYAWLVILGAASLFIVIYERKTHTPLDDLIGITRRRLARNPPQGGEEASDEDDAPRSSEDSVPSYVDPRIRTGNAVQVFSSLNDNNLYA